MKDLGNSSLAARLAPPPALAAMLDQDRRLTTHLSGLMTPPPALAAVLDQDRRLTTHLSRLATPPSALTAMLDRDRRLTSHLSGLMTPPPALRVSFPRFESPVSAFPKTKFGAAPALIGMATPPGVTDLLGNSAIPVGYSTLREALATATAVFEHSAIREVIGGIAGAPDSVIPEFSVAAFSSLRFANAAFLGDYDYPADAVDLVRSQITDIGSRLDEDRRAVHIVIKRVGKGLVMLIKWGGRTVATIVAYHYLEPYLVFLPQP